MKLGILVNTTRHLPHVLGITRAASEKGHHVSLFAMDEGTKLLRESAYRELCHLENVDMSLCRHSAEQHHVALNELSPDIVAGSQLNNAIMNSEADKVIVL